MKSTAIGDYIAKLNILMTPDGNRRESELPEVTAVVIPVPGKKGADTEKKASILGADLVITGSVTSESDIILKGYVHGDVSSKGNVEVLGRVEGNVSGKNVRVAHADIAGNVQAEERLSVSESRVTGDLSARSADIDSKVIGNISTDGLLLVKRSADIKGDMTASAVSVEENAILDGKITINRP